MSHCVPNLDVLSSEVDDAHPCPLPSEKGEVAALFFSDGGGVEYSSARKRTSACIPDGMVSYMPWMETENDEEKRTNVFEMSQESGLAIDVSPSHTPFQEDEMLSWLQYPLDDTFSKAYCSEQQYEQTFTSFSSQNLFPKASGERLSTSSLSTKLIENSDSNILGQSVTTDAALALGAERAAGLALQAGAEVFDRVHTIRQACDDVPTSKATECVDNPNINHSVLENVGKRNSMNFPFFSQHVAAIKSSVQIVGAANGPLIKDRLRQSTIIQSNEGTASTGQLTSTASLTNFNPLGESGLNEVKQETDAIAQAYLDNVGCDDDKARQAEMELTKYSLAVSTDFLETADVTLTSLSGESDYSTGKSTKELSGKMPAEETDCESKDTGGVPLRKIGPTVARTTSVKRARAAEVHNQSERRRRNKINEKMKALQELIPNANKTDKASMLDEAIEYVKMLQAQLQLMSTRTGMIVPPIVMPPGMQYLSLQQRPNTAGLNMGLGPRVMDASTSGVGASPKLVFLGQPVPGQHVYHHIAGYPVVHEVQSHLQLNAMQNVPGFQQFQPGHMQQSNDIYKANSDLGKRQQG